MSHNEIPVQVTAGADEGVADLVTALEHVPGVITPSSCEPGPDRARVTSCTHDRARSAARQHYAGVMIRPSSDGRRLTAHLEPGGPCIATAERQPDGRWLVNGRAMTREHAGIALEAAVTVAAASRPPHGPAQVPEGPRTEASAASSAITPEIIQ